MFKDKSMRVDPRGLYDPCFLLPLFVELTRPGKHCLPPRVGCVAGDSGQETWGLSP